MFFFLFFLLFLSRLFQKKKKRHKIQTPVTTGDVLAGCLNFSRDSFGTSWNWFLKTGVNPGRSVLVVRLDGTKWLSFSSLLGAMILATCLAACLIEQPSINPLNIYTINNDDHNDDDDKKNKYRVVQNMQFATFSYI